MLKAVFLDLYGTAVQEYGPIALEVAQTICDHSDLSSQRDVLHFWWKHYRSCLPPARGEHFRTQRDIALESFQVLLAQFHGEELQAEALVERMEEHWCTAPIYPDTVSFLEWCPLPVHFLTNSDDRYARGVVDHYGLQPASLLTSEQARCYKPDPEIFRFALQQTGLRPEEVVFAGDSLPGDVLAPTQAGLSAIWVNRAGESVPPEVTAVSGLEQLADLLASCAR